MGAVPRHRPLPSTLNRYPSLSQRPRRLAARSHVRPAKSRGFSIASQSQPGGVHNSGKLPSPPAPTLPAGVAFADPDPFQTLTYPTIIAAKLAIADEIGMA